MGNALMNKKSVFPPLREETQMFALWTINDLKELLKRFHNQIHGFALVEAQFESIMAFKPNLGDRVPLEVLFEVLDNDHDGRIDGLELLGGLTLVCNATFEEKARFCFELFDFNLNSIMSKKELIMMMMSSVSGMNLLTGGSEELEPDIEVFEALAEDAVLRADKNSDNQISFEEFLYWARSNRELMAGLEALNKVSLQAKDEIDPEDSAPETDDEHLSETDTGAKKRIRPAEGVISKSDKALLARGPSRGDEAENVSPWLGQVFEPTNYKKRRGRNDGPDTNLELSWAFGYHCERARNNIHYVGGVGVDFASRYIVYYTAALGVVHHPQTKKQTFYMGHSDEITCIALHPGGQIVATGDCKSNIHIWNVDAHGVPSALCVMSGIVKEGIMHLAFSPAGDRIVSVGCDSDHTVCFHNVNSGEIISSTQGLQSPNTVYDIAYSTDGTELALVGKQEVKFCTGVHSNKRAVDSYMGKIGSQGKRQTFFSVTYFKDDCIVGCASGELYRFREGQCIEIVQAHGLREPVLCMFYNAEEGTLITGGKDCLIKTWDFTLKEVGEPIDVSEDADSDGKADNGSLDCAVMSVQRWDDAILLGTQGGDIFEAFLPPQPGAPHSLNRVAWGHPKGELWGLAVHPLRDEFATSGDDKTLRIWSIRSHEQINVRVMPEAARALAYSPNGEILCLGMMDGSMALMESNTSSLRVYATWKHSDLIISAVRFSPDGTFIAAGSGDTNIYLYKSADQKTYQRQAICRGHTGPITHLDFSANSQYLQSNGTDYALLFWDIEGNQVKKSASLRDVVWATYTCTLGWPVQGIWPTGCDYSDINSCQAMPDLGDIVTGDDFGKVRLFRYPALKPDSLNQSYVGHAGHVTCVRFTASRRYVVSIGGADRTVLVWRHDVELCESDHEGAGADGNSDSEGSAASSADEGGTADGIDPKQEIADVGVRSLEQEAVNMGWTVSELKEFEQIQSAGGPSVAFPELTAGDQSAAPIGEEHQVQPWKSVVVEPSEWKPSYGATDVDLELCWVHGHRSYDCRNNVLYSASGAIVYNAAALAVVYNKGAGKQQFLRGVHTDEVTGIASHPAGQVFATGEAGRNPSIFIWNSKDMEVLGSIKNSHERGVPLLAFNSTGKILASIGLDGNSTLCLHEWLKGVEILRTPTNKGKVLALCFLANDSADVDLSITESATPKLTASIDGGLSKKGARDIVVTAGERHLHFWWTQGQNVQSQRALWGRHREAKRSTIMCVASANPDICVTGSASGGLMIWEKFRAVCDVREYVTAFERPETLPVDPEDPLTDNSLIPAAGYPHKSTIQSMWAVPGSIDVRSSTQDCLDGYHTSARYITGDKDGQVAIWRMVRPSNSPTLLRLVLIKVFNVLSLKPAPLGASVRSVCMRDGMILLGLKSSEIMEVAEASLAATVSRTRSGDTPFTGTGRVPMSLPGTPGLPPLATPLVTSSQANQTVASQRLIVGHSTGEVWGLSMHPFLPVFITSGDDCTLKCWNLATHRLVSYIVLPDKCRAVDFEPTEGMSFSLALNSGVIWVLSSDILFGKKGGAFDINIDGIDVTNRIAVSPSGTPTSTTTAPAANGDAPPLRPSSSTATLCTPKVLTGPTQWVHTLKYSFEGSLLGAASQDHNLYLYDVSDGYAPMKNILSGHTSFVSHFDFGFLPRQSVERKPDEAKTLPDGAIETTAAIVTTTEVYDPESRTVVPTQATLTVVSVTDADGAVRVVDERLETVRLPLRNLDRKDICLQSTSGAGELFFWMADGTRVHSAAAMKDVWWATLSCPFGWPVQGIWPIEPDGTEVNAVARSHSWEQVPVLATVDNFGRLRMYNYPCVVPGASDKCYRGHASNVTRVLFSHDDAYCVTLGGSDKCVYVWATDIQDEIRERTAYSVAAAPANSNEPVSTPLDTVDEDEELAVSEDVVADSDENMSVFKLPFTAGDQSGAIKPWKTAVREPSHWTDPEDLGEEPDASLELKHVYGYRGWDCRNNIGFADSRFEIVYHVAGVGVVFNSKDNKQLHNTEHDDDILCLDVHPEGHTVATGEIGKFPKIVLWDANTGVTIRVIQFHKRGVANLAFSANGEMLVSTGMDDDRTVAVHNVRTGAVLGKGKAGRGVDIYTVSVGGNEVFVTGGKNHVKFWSLPQSNSPGGELSSKTGIYNLKAVKERTVVSSAFLGSDAVTGMKDGHILLWKDRTNTKFVKAHEGPVNAMYAISDSSPGIDTRELGPRVITGGKDGFVHIWDLQLRKKWSLNMTLTEPLSACPQIKAVATKENRLIIGTQASEIYEVSLLSNAEVYRHVQGHYDSRAEVWGVAAHPTLPQFVTCGDDMTVRLWNAKCLQQMEIVHVGAKVRAVAISPDGSQVAVATYEGKVLVLSANLKKQEASVTISNSWTEVMQYSPDGKLLAVGTHDDTIYLLETRAYACKFKLRGHHSFITGIDFSADSRIMQSVSGDYELLFWDATMGKQITSPTEVRDTKWATFTCKLGWPVQGIWPAEADGTDVNSVDRSPDGAYLVSGDDFSRVKLFRYPCVKERSQFKEYKGHAEHVMKVRFSHDSKYVYSVGGLDKAILQFEVKRDSGSKKKKAKMVGVAK